MKTIKTITEPFRDYDLCDYSLMDTAAEKSVLVRRTTLTDEEARVLNLAYATNGSRLRYIKV